MYVLKDGKYKMNNENKTIMSLYRLLSDYTDGDKETIHSIEEIFRILNVDTATFEKHFKALDIDLEKIEEEA